MFTIFDQYRLSTMNIKKHAHVIIFAGLFLSTLMAHAHGPYHGHGEHFHGGSRWGGHWGGPWYGPNVIIDVPIGGYYRDPYPYYYEPECRLIDRCYPNGECIETEICD